MVGRLGTSEQVVDRQFEREDFVICAKNRPNSRAITDAFRLDPGIISSQPVFPRLVQSFLSIFQGIHEPILIHMLIAFYAPLKSPAAPRPSGDRRIARLFLAALQKAGLETTVASELRAWEGKGNEIAQDEIRLAGERAAAELIDRYRALPVSQRPAAWFTYHLYHKAPDWIGPSVARALEIPYFVAEASVARKQETGAWQSGFQQTQLALSVARAVFTLNPADAEGIQPWLGPGGRMVSMTPFLDGPTQRAGSRHEHKRRLGAKLKINADRYWLLCVAMMREDSKLESYRALSTTLDLVKRSDWSLLIVGDGVAQAQVRELFRYDNARQVFFLGRRDTEAISDLMGASDLLVWPAINEAIGMVALEALQTGLPVVWGRSGGVDGIVDHGRTGLLIDQPGADDAPARIAAAVEQLLDNPARLATMSAESMEKFAAQHTLDQAAALLGEVIGSG